MTTITKKIYKNNSNGQLLITAPKCFNEGDEVVLTLSKTAYETIQEKTFLMKISKSDQTSEFLQQKLSAFWGDEFHDVLAYSYAEESFYESWEDLEALGLELDFRINVVTATAIDFYVRLTKRKNYKAPNEEMIKSIMKLINEDFGKEFKKFLINSLDYLVN